MQRRLAANDEIIGSDELFFEDSSGRTFLQDLYNEKAGVLDDAPDEDVDLASQAYQIWTEATENDPALEKAVTDLPPVIYATQRNATGGPPGVLVYLRTAEGYDALTWVNTQGQRVTESQFEILRAARCAPDTPALPRIERHHELVETGVKGLLSESGKPGGQLGRPSGVRSRTYHKLKAYAREIEGSLFQTPDLSKAIEEVYRAPLTDMAEATLKRHLSNGLDGRAFAGAVAELRSAGDLVQHLNADDEGTAQIICSLGLSPDDLPALRPHMTLDPRRVRDLLDEHKFEELFREELYWSRPALREPSTFEVEGETYTRRQVAEAGGVAAFVVQAESGAVPDAAARKAVYASMEQTFGEPLLIFVDQAQSQSLWTYARREQGKVIVRSHLYAREQPVDLFLSKLAGLLFEVADFDESGRIPLLRATERVRRALDVEAVTKTFFKDFRREHDALIAAITGIPDEGDKRWYASVLLTRLMFVYFLQKKGFLDGGDYGYLGASWRSTRRRSRVTSGSHRSIVASCALCSSRGSQSRLLIALPRPTRS